MTYNAKDDGEGSYLAAIEAKRRRGDTHGWQMRRSFERWERMSPKAVASGSQAQSEFCIDDARHDILFLRNKIEALNWAIEALVETAESAPAGVARDGAVARGRRLYEQVNLALGAGK